MLATLEPKATDRAVLARLHDPHSAEVDTDAVLGIVRRAVADEFARPAAPVLRVAGHANEPLGTTPAARVLERYLDRLHDRLTLIGEAIDRADADAVDDLLHEVARASRQHGCRSVCAAAEAARTSTRDRSAASIDGLRGVVGELGQLADEVADTARRWTVPADMRPRA